MRLSTSIGVFLNAQIEWEQIVDLLCNAGFDAIDFSFENEKLYCAQTDTDSFRQRLMNLKDYAADKGMVFNQAHAPFISSSCPESRKETIFEEVVRSMRSASCLGIPHIIVHPLKYLDYTIDGNPQRLFEMNMEFFNRLKPYCEEYNIKVCLENLWQYLPNRKIWKSVCATPQEFNMYLDNLDNNWFGACLDIGHSLLVGEKPDEFINKLGTRLMALHIHDTNGFTDNHTLPYLGIADWDKITQGLALNNYSGDFTFEALGFCTNMPQEMWTDALKMMSQTGRFLMSKISASKC